MTIPIIDFSQLGVQDILIIPCVKSERKKTLKFIDKISKNSPSDWYSAISGLLEVHTLDHGKHLLHWTGKTRWILLGIEESKDFQKISTAIRSVVYKALKEDEKNHAVCLLPAFLKNRTRAALSNGLSMAFMKTDYFKTDKKEVEGSFNYFLEDQNDSASEEVAEGLTLADTQKEICKLVNLPPNEKTPAYIVDWARQRFDRKHYSIKIYDREMLVAAGLDALYQVGKGSQHSPFLLVIKYKHSKAKSKNKHISLVGKGVTFDTGGISLKDPLNMYLMKSDMGGAASVLGAMDILGALNMPVHVTAVIPLAENAIGPDAYRPGDVISSYSGKSIEVIDTDAEGRLILADAIAYSIKNFKPDVLVDLATLTGSIIATLGYKAAGLFSNDDDLAKSITRVAEACGERVWRLPVWDDYQEEMNSDIADIKNLATKPLAGAITAAKFLQAFTDDHPSWAHLDIAGVAMTDNEFGKQRNATAFGVLLLKDWIHHYTK
ncbi:MAG: leucyl aminopeptidase [Saprospiraceae bacterium]|nr:leucyl aminopeptidase [Saprospiraceae bacterium]